MKKLFLILIMTATVATAWSQSQLSTVRGKTKDGKTIKVDYYKGSVEDVIQSVKYQLVDELQAEKKKLQDQLKNCADPAEVQRLKNQVTEKEKQINKLNKEIERLKAQITPTPTIDDCSELQQQIEEKDATINSLNKQVVKLNVDVSQAKKEKDALSKQLEECEKQKDCGEEVATLKQKVKERDEQLRKQNSQIVKNERTIDSLKRQHVSVVPSGDKKPAPTPVIGVELGFGPAFPGSSISEPWAKEVKTCFNADVYFGSARLSESFPISVEAGLGIRSFSIAARLNEYATTLEAMDIDGDTYHAIYAFNGLEENLSLTYFDIPLRLCIGQPAKERVTAYAKLGLTPSINVSSTFSGAGTYNLKGYYPQWDVTLENIEHLGFGSDMACYENIEPEINKFNLWGNVAFGAYVPFKGSPIVLNAGVKLDYPFMAIGSIKGSDTLPEGKSGLLQNGGKVVIPSVEFGLVYTLK